MKNRKQHEKPPGGASFLILHSSPKFRLSWMNPRDSAVPAKGVCWQASAPLSPTILALTPP